MSEGCEDVSEAWEVWAQTSWLQDGRKKKTAEFVSMNRIWLRENPTNGKIERNKGYLAINKLPYRAKDPCR